MDDAFGNPVPDTPDGPYTMLGELGPPPTPPEIRSPEQWVWDTLGANAHILPLSRFQSLLWAEARKLRSKYPCIVTNGALNLTGDDLAFFNEAVGLAVAARFVATGDTTAGAGRVQKVKRKMGPVEHTYATSNPADSAGTWAKAGMDALKEIACIKAGRKAMGLNGTLLVGVNPSRNEAGQLVVEGRVL